MVTGKDYRTGCRQMIEAFDLDTTVQRKLIETDKGESRPALCPHLAGARLERHCKKTNPGRRKKAQQSQISGRMFLRRRLFNAGNPTGNLKFVRLLRHHEHINTRSLDYDKPKMPEIRKKFGETGNSGQTLFFCNPRKFGSDPNFPSPRISHPYVASGFRPVAKRHKRYRNQKFLLY